MFFNLAAFDIEGFYRPANGLCLRIDNYCSLYFRNDSPVVQRYIRSNRLETNRMTLDSIITKPLLHIYRSDFE
jgi:hypothetical protein